MLRLIHKQTTAGAILVDDIDDGLPNKTTHRLGSTGDPKAYVRDGYSTAPKQSCYVPHTDAANPSLAGFIDLAQTPRVSFSAGKGKISLLERAGLLEVVTFDAEDIEAPTLASAEIDDPGAGDLTLTGTKLTSVAPYVTTVTVETPNAFLDVAGAANGSVRYVAVAEGSTGTAITIEHVVAGNNTPLTIGVVGNAITVNVATDGGGVGTSTAADVVAAIEGSVAASALVTATALGTGLGLVAAAAAAPLARPGATLTAEEITTGTGTVSATSIVIPAALVPGIAAALTEVTVEANGQSTSTVAVS